MTSLFIDYKSNTSVLCELGRKYDTDKSSQRDNATDCRHCHPYTLFYDGLFKNKKNESLKIAELGILDGGSLLMWQEYFKNAKIFGFDFNEEFIEKFKKNHNNDRIVLANLDVKNAENIRESLEKSNEMFDIILEDTTYIIDDQIRVIENAYQFLKPGGLLIIEDILKSNNEKEYLYRLKKILDQFQDYYFITLEHENRISTGWDNDKLFILVKSGGEPIFKNKNKLTIITPSYRTYNLEKIMTSINFNYVNEWIIVYDATKIVENPLIFKNENPKIKEYIFKWDNEKNGYRNEEGISGNDQRNYALSIIAENCENRLLYFLDDDNVIHPDLYKLLNIIDDGKIYTFNRREKGLKGNNINVGHIDTSMFLVDHDLCKGIKWKYNDYTADGIYIKECYEKNKKNHIYVDNELAYTNFLS